jgi:hypothetical protein
MLRINSSKAALIILAMLAIPSTASAGFFDQFFGGGARSGTFFGFPTYGSDDNRPVRHYQPRKIVDEKPILQKTTDLMHDATLRPGDAVMTSSGIKIFTGRREQTHDLEDFTPLRNARYVRRSEKLALSELDAPRDGSAIVRASGDLVTGRSAALSNPVSNGPIVKGVMIKERDGKEIRFVGP